jgi:diacylglycerol O-acyltransferase / wax synthase
VTAEPLSAADRGALQAEVGPVNMAVAGAMVFDAGEGTTHEAVCARVGERLHLLPRYRQKLRDPLGPLTNPVWIDDDGFDLQWHIRHARLPGSGSRAELAGYVAREMATRLHRDRPLWELHVIDGLAGGQVALLAKMHHALVDGIAAIGIGIILLDPTPEPMPVDGPEVEWAPRPFDARRHLAARATGTGLSMARGLLNRALDPLGTADDLRKGTELASELARQRPQAPMTPLNRPISPNRAYAMRAHDLASIKAAGKAAGGTVNDVILAVVAGTLRRYFRAAGTDLRGRDPVALVPVNIRRDEDEASSGGNRLSTVFVDLPASEAALDERIARVGAQMRALRESAAVRAGAVIAGAAGQAPPLIASLMVRATGSVRAMNLVVSNVPGPQQTFYMNGRPLLEVYPAVPLNPANQGFNVGVMSYDGRVFFGLCADARLEPGVEVAADALGAELAAMGG